MTIQSLRNFIVQQRTLILASILASTLTACGSGGGSSSSSPSSDNGSLDRITYHALPTSIEVNEGEQARISLNTSGSEAKDVKFEWTVSNSQFDDISFTGQGSDTIEFTAPDVDTLGTIYVSVDLASSNKTTVIGFISQDVIVTVLDLDPPQHSGGEPGQLTNLPKVAALNFDILTENSTWLQKQTVFRNLENEQGHTEYYDIGLYNYAYIDSVDVSNQSITTTICGSENVSEFKLGAFSDDVDCGNETSTLNFYQSTDAIFLERVCGNEVITTASFIKKADERTRNFGELAMTFTNQAELPTTTDVCGIMSAVELEVFDPATSERASVEASIINIYTEYENNPLLLEFELDELPLFGSTSLTPFFERGLAYLTSVSLPEFAERSQSTGGRIVYNLDNTITNIDAEFEFSLATESAGEEEIEGTFQLIFE